MINKVILIGNVGAEPNVRALDGGVKVASLRLATTEKYKKEDGSIAEQTEWHTIEAWRNIADIIDKWVNKGDRIYIEGQLRTRAYADKENIERKMTSVVAKEIKLLSPKEKKDETKPQSYTTPVTTLTPSAKVAQPSAQSRASIPPEIPLPPMPTDDLPF